MILNDSPFVSIVIPVRNESFYIERCLRAVFAQNYPHQQLEVFILDGLSQDGTHEIVQRMLSQHAINTQLINNPEHIVPTGMNRGIRAARGEIIVRVDGHCVIAQDYIERCVNVLNRVDADCVGGAIQTMGETTMSRAIAFAQSSPFGVGNAAFRYAKTPQYVDTLAFGAYRREVFERIGLFDEELVRNQDDEFNFRLTKAGGRIWLDPQIRSTYFSRATLRGLWKQYFEYGLWKVRVIQKHGRPASWRHLVPVLFVFTLLSGLALIWWQPARSILGLILAAYFSANMAASALTAAKHGWRYFFLLPVAYVILHVSYGFGFLCGLLKFIGRWGDHTGKVPRGFTP